MPSENPSSVWSTFGIPFGTAILGALATLLVAKGTDWISDSFKPALPQGSIVMTDSPDCKAFGENWSLVLGSADHFIKGAGPADQIALPKDGVSKFTIKPANLPPLNMTATESTGTVHHEPSDSIPFILAIGQDAQALVDRGQGVRKVLTVAISDGEGGSLGNREGKADPIDTTPSFLPLTLCKKVR